MNLIKELGYEPFDVEDLLNNENTKENKEKKEDINNDNINNENINKDIKENNEEENNQKEEKEKENIIQNNLDSDGKIIRVESTNEGEETKNDNINKKLEIDNNKDIKEELNKNLPDNNDHDNINEIKIDDNNDNNNHKNESIEQRISSNNNNGIILSSNTNKNQEEEVNTDLNTKKFFTEEEFSEFTFVLVKNLEVKKITADIAKEKIILLQNKSEEIPNDKFIQQMSHNILKCLNNNNEESIQKLDKWLNFLLNISENNQNIMTEKFLSLLTNIKIYKPEEELLLSKKVKKYLLPKKDILLSKLEPFKNKYISFLFLKQIIEEQKIEMKDDYSQYLFYALKNFDDPGVSLYDLKVKNLFDILNNTENDSKMEEESDIEITNEEFTTIISNFIFQLMNYLNKNKISLRDLLKEMIQTLNVEEEEELNQEKIEIVLVEPFIKKMKDIGIQINNDIEIFCIYNRYKLTDEYEIISINLLEKELENFRQMNSNNNINMPSNAENKDKLMEKVQEETEDNVSNSVK